MAITCTCVYIDNNNGTFPASDIHYNSLSSYVNQHSLIRHLQGSEFIFEVAIEVILKVVEWTKKPDVYILNLNIFFNGEHFLSHQNAKIMPTIN